MRTYNEKISIYHGMASTIALNFSNNFFPIFAITMLGATNYQVGLDQFIAATNGLGHDDSCCDLNQSRTNTEEAGSHVYLTCTTHVPTDNRNCLLAFPVNTCMAISSHHRRNEFAEYCRQYRMAGIH